MPLKKHYKGKGEEVMRSMKKRYGEEEGERIFYATENKKKSRSKGRRKR